MEVSGKRAESVEGNDFPTINAPCVLCKGDTVSTQANGFCKECKEIMCTACFRKHLRLKSCQNHTLLDTIAPSETDMRRTLSEMKCKHHGGETVKFYCRKHEAVGCGDCVVSDHNGCKTEFIKNLSDNFQQNEDYRKCMKQLEKLVSERRKFVKKIQESKKENKVMLEKALGDIKEFRLDINKYLDKVERDIEFQVKSVMEENQTVLTKLENDCTVLSTKLEEITNMLNRELYTDNALFIHTVECKPKITGSEKAISDMKLRSMKKYEFVRDQQLHGAVTSAQKFGTLAFLSSAVFPQITDRSSERSRIKQDAVNNAEGTHIRTEDVGRGNTKEESAQKLGTFSSSAVFPQTTDRSIERSRIQKDAGNSAEGTHIRNEGVGRENTKKNAGVRSVVRVGDRVQYNERVYGKLTYADLVRLTGSVTDVHDNSMVTVKWDYDGLSSRHRVGKGYDDLTLI